MSPSIVIELQLLIVSAHTSRGRIRLSTQTQTQTETHTHALVSLSLFFSIQNITNNKSFQKSQATRKKSIELVATENKKKTDYIINMSDYSDRFISTGHGISHEHIRPKPIDKELGEDK